MTLDVFIKQIKDNQPIAFHETLSIIEHYYTYQPCEFSNGLGNDKVVNKAETNEGSCKLFSFAKLHHLNQQQTLNLFGEHYQSVLAEPEATAHQNIRNFIKYGWDGIVFLTDALQKK